MPRNVRGNSPAEAAGLRKGDEIISINGERVYSAPDVLRMVGSRRVGDRIEMAIRRDGQKQLLAATLGHLPGTPTAAAPREPSPKVTAAWPQRIVVPRPDGTLQVLPLPPEPGASGWQPLPPALTVERSNVEKKLEELSRDVRELKQQIERLSRRLLPPDAHYRNRRRRLPQRDRAPSGKDAENRQNRQVENVVPKRQSRPLEGRRGPGCGEAGGRHIRLAGAAGWKKEPAD